MSFLLYEEKSVLTDNVSETESSDSITDVSTVEGVIEIPLKDIADIIIIANTILPTPNIIFEFFKFFELFDGVV